MTLFDSHRWQVLDALLDEALDRQGTEREEWLQRLSDERPDDALDLARVLADYTASARVGFLGGVLAAEPTGYDDEPLVGQAIGSYTLEALVGQGGMGSVWRARRSDGRYTGTVAIKLLNLALIGRASGHRFEREGRILAQLTHPHIARLIDAGITRGGQPYLAIEFVEGAPIDRFCDGAEFDTLARVRVFLDVLSAVAHSHAHLVVHRDLKPLNVLVDRSGCVKLLDFGIAKLLGDEVESGVAQTQADARILTPEYSSPEQVRGDPVTTATDIYALGVLMYVLLSGTHPTGSPGASTAELLRAVTGAEPRRMSATFEDLNGATMARARARGSDPRKLRRSLRGDLDNIVAKAMHKDPHRRYATVQALADDLQRHLDNRPVAARADTLRYRVARFAARNRSAVAAGALATIAVIGGVSGTIMQAQRARAERDQALRQLSYAEASDDLLAFLLREVGDRPFTKSQLLSRGEASIAAQFASQPTLRTRMLVMLSDLYGDSMQQNRANALLEQATVSAGSADDPSVQAQLDCALAERRGDENDFDGAASLFARGIARLQRTEAPDRAVLADCLGARAQVGNLRGDPRAAKSDAQAALTAYGNPRPGQETGVLLARAALAEANGRLGSEALAIAGYEEVLAELKRLGRDRNNNELSTLVSLGVHLSRAGQWRRSADVYRRGLELASVVQGSAGDLPPLQGNYAKLLLELGDAASSQKMFGEALSAAEADGHTRSIGTIELMAGPAWCATGDLARCRALLSDADRRLRPSLPAGHTLLGGLAFEQGRLALREHDLPLARARLGLANAIYLSAGERNPNQLRAASWLALAEAQAGDLSAGRAHAEQAVAAARAALGGFQHSVFLGEALLTLGQVASMQGDVAAVREAVSEAVIDFDDALGPGTPPTLEATRLLTVTR